MSENLFRKARVWVEKVLGLYGPIETGSEHGTEFVTSYVSGVTWRVVLAIWKVDSRVYDLLGIGVPPHSIS